MNYVQYQLYNIYLYIQAELRRIGRKIEKRENKKNNDKEEEYIRGLIQNKKKDGDLIRNKSKTDDVSNHNNATGIRSASAIVDSLVSSSTQLLESANAWLFPNIENKKVVAKKVYILILLLL